MTRSGICEKSRNFAGFEFDFRAFAKDKISVQVCGINLNIKSVQSSQVFINFGCVKRAPDWARQKLKISVSR